MWYRDQEYYDTSPWRGKWTSEGGGSLINQASHSIDLMIWLLGEPKKVFGVLALKHIKLKWMIMQQLWLNLKMECSPRSKLSTSLQPGYPAKVNIFGTEGSISIDGNALKIVDKDKNETNYDYESEVGSSNDPKEIFASSPTTVIGRLF